MKDIPHCSAATAAELYRLLEYYRHFMPYCLGVSESEYALTQEAINADAGLAAYRNETGKKESPKPSPPKTGVRFETL